MIKLRKRRAPDSAEMPLFNILNRLPKNPRPQKILNPEEHLAVKKPKKRPGDPPLKPPPPRKPSKPEKHPRKPGDPRRTPTKGKDYHKKRKVWAHMKSLVIIF